MKQDNKIQVPTWPTWNSLRSLIPHPWGGSCRLGSNCMRCRLKAWPRPKRALSKSFSLRSFTKRLKCIRQPRKSSFQNAKQHREAVWKEGWSRLINEGFTAQILCKFMCIYHIYIIYIYICIYLFLNLFQSLSSPFVGPALRPSQIAHGWWGTALPRPLISKFHDTTNNSSQPFESGELSFLDQARHGSWWSIRSSRKSTVHNNISDHEN